MAEPKELLVTITRSDEPVVRIDLTETDGSGAWYFNVSPELIQQVIAQAAPRG